MHKKIGKKYQKDEKKKDQKRFLEASLVRQADGKLKNRNKDLETSNSNFLEVPMSRISYWF